MCLPDSCCETVKWVNTQTGASVHILPNLYEWLHLLQPPSPTVQSRWMGICWPPPHRQLSAVFEVKQHPWLGAKSIFSGGCCCCCYSRPRQAEPASERRTEGRDPHRCLIKVWSSGETENVCGAWPALASSPQRTLSTRRTPLHLFIAQRAHTTYNIRFHLWRGWGGGSVSQGVRRSCACMFCTCIGPACVSPRVWKLKGNRSLSMWGQAAFSAASLSIN